MPLADVPLRAGARRAARAAGLRRQRRDRWRRSPRRTTATSSSIREPGHVHGRHRGRRRARPRRAALPGRDRRGRRARPHADRRRPDRPAFPTPASFPQRGLARVARRGLGARPARRGGRRREHPDSYLGERARRAATRSPAHDAVEGAKAGDEVAIGAARAARRAARDRDRERDQHVRPRRRRDRRRASRPPATCCSSRRGGSRWRTCCPGSASETEIRLSRHGPKAGVLGAALLAKLESEATRREREPMTATTTQTDIDELAVNTIRTLAMDAVQKANSGHPGTPMGLAPLGYVLYSQVMRHNPREPAAGSTATGSCSAPGHACMLQYSLPAPLRLRPLARRHQAVPPVGEQVPGPPRVRRTPPGVEISTGPARPGLRQRASASRSPRRTSRRSFNRAAQRDRRPPHLRRSAATATWRRGSPREAASLAGNLGLGKLIAIYDDNEISIEGSTHLAFHDKVAQPLRRPTAGRVHEARDRLDAGARSSWRSREAQGGHRPALAGHPALPHRLRQPEQAGHRRPPTARRSARRRSS